ncbi:hypothetical protein JCM10213_004368 [Rhodosporidiobolus nylandii]
MLSFAPTDLFPPTQSTSAAPQAVPASSVALLGPLVTSSLLHLALNHLRPEEERKQDVSSLSETAKGKQRVTNEGSVEEEDVPLLRRKTRRERRVLILTPDRDVLREELSKESDVSLFGARRSGETARLLDLVDIRHLPSSAHLTYFLSTCYTSSSSSAFAASSAYLATNPKTRLDPSYLPYEPTLVVLHAPSDYLEEPANQGAGIESYASLLALFVSTFSSLCKRPPLLVLHDPSASNLSLPILAADLGSKDTANKRPRPGRVEEGEESEQPEDDEADRLALLRIAERFFDWTGETCEGFRDQLHAGRATTHHVLSLHPSPYLPRPANCPEKVEVE